MIRLIIRGQDETQTMAFAAGLVDHCKDALGQQQSAVRILGPAPAPIAKLRDRFRIHVLLMGLDGAGLRQAVRQLIDEVKPVEGIQWVVDVDPLSLL